MPLVRMDPKKLDTKLREYTGVQAKGKAMSMRRKHPPEFKAKVVMEILSAEMTTMEASRKSMWSSDRRLANTRSLNRTPTGY